jgi:C_GCAxxG_C_C family probable redox protein
MDRAEHAVTLFKSGFNCAQAVLASWAEELGLDEKTALKLAGGLGGGVGRRGGICGALTGAILVLGLRYGTADPKDKAAKYDLYRKAADLSDAFKARTGSIYCRELLGFDLGTPAGETASKNPGAFDECPHFVREAAELLTKMIS